MTVFWTELTAYTSTSSRENSIELRLWRLASDLAMVQIACSREGIITLDFSSGQGISNRGLSGGHATSAHRFSWEMIRHKKRTSSSQ